MKIQAVAVVTWLALLMKQLNLMEAERGQILEECGCWGLNLMAGHYEEVEGGLALHWVEVLL